MNETMAGVNRDKNSNSSSKGNGVKKPLTPQQVANRKAKNARRRERRKNKLAESQVMGLTPMMFRGGEAGLNPADPRSETSVLQMGSTPSGRTAALKVLHPNMEACQMVVKFPDGAVSTSVSMERRDEFEIPPFPPTVSTDKWDCIVMHLPFLVGRQGVIKWNSTLTTPSEATLQRVVQVLLENIGSPDRQYPLWYAYTADGIPFLISILSSSVLTSGVAYSGVSGLSLYAKSIRRTCLGVTTDLDASDLYNNGRVVSGQWTPDVTTARHDTTDIVTGFVMHTFDIYQMQVPAVTTSSIVSSDEFSRQAEAKTGSYMPLRTCSSTINMTPVQQWRNLAIELPGVDADTITSSNCNDLFLQGWSIGVEYWSGLSNQANLRMKVREDLEIVPSPDSPYSPFATPAYPDDVRARAVIQEFSRKQPHAYPASYNENNILLKKLISAVGEVVEDLGLPILSPLVKGVRNFLDSKLWSHISNLF
ncbi:putative capsid protein [Hubei permutotetra-like virus 6]|uniref:putative capsid protein n=1 Tax=Hubei permutotetra-like virus 6 TaxID=1923080 RepID=UPI00090B33F8|nr:putative capsid protein [Hubei permutotetra-like virus 6]APG76932.1 putative capsid protein [Hubei permutotetra-like virus 6]